MSRTASSALATTLLSAIAFLPTGDCIEHSGQWPVTSGQLQLGVSRVDCDSLLDGFDTVRLDPNAFHVRTLAVHFADIDLNHPVFVEAHDWEHSAKAALERRTCFE